MDATVVVATRNGAGTIGECLAALCRQTCAPDRYEVVVVDDGSTDGVHLVAGRFAASHPDRAVRVVRLPGPAGLAAARNTGVIAARGAVVLFTDDDAIPDDDWIERILAAFAPGVDGAGGLWRPATDDAVGLYVLARSRHDYGPSGEKGSGAGGQNMAFRASVLQRIGLFDPVFESVSDDADLNRRLVEEGAKLTVSPQITVRHRTPPSLSALAVKAFHRGAGARLFHAKYHSDPLGLRGVPKLLATILSSPRAWFAGRDLAGDLGRPELSGSMGLSWLLDNLAHSAGFAWADLDSWLRWFATPIGRVRRLGLSNGLESLVSTPYPAHKADRYPRFVVGGPFFSRSHGRLSCLWARALDDERRLAAVLPEGCPAALPEAEVYVATAGHALDTFRRVAAVRPGALRILRRECTHVRAVEDALRNEALSLGVLPTFQSARAITAQESEYELADRIVVPSRFSQRGFVERGWPADRVEVLNPGVDTHYFRPAPDARSDRFTVLFVGLLGMRKGIVRLLRAWQRVGPGTKGRLQIIGRIQPDLPRSAAALLDQPGVRWRRSVLRFELGEYYRNAWVTCLPSVEDGWGLSIHESMACETPVIVSDRCGVAEIVSHERAGFVLPAGDEDRLADALLKLASSRSLVDEMGREARAVALRFDEERYRRSIADLAARPPGPGSRSATAPITGLSGIVSRGPAAGVTGR